MRKPQLIEMEQLLDFSEEKQVKRKQLRKLIGRSILFQSLVSGVLFYSGSLWMYFNLKPSGFDLFELVFIIGGGLHILFTLLMLFQYFIDNSKVIERFGIQLALYLFPLIAPLIPMMMWITEGTPIKARSGFAMVTMSVYYIPVVIIAFLLFRRKLKQSL